MATQTLSAKNKAFWKMKPTEQRVAIAKDVLKQLSDKFYKAKTGDYLLFRNTPEIDKIPAKLDNLLSLLKRSKARCEVCGIGSIFVSMVNLGNKITTNECDLDKEISEYYGVDDSLMREKLDKIFSAEQRSLIEAAFERSTSLTENDYEKNEEAWEKIREAMEFGAQFKTPSNRLKAIMKNIIKNKGTFIP